MWWIAGGICLILVVIYFVGKDLMEISSQAKHDTKKERRNK